MEAVKCLILLLIFAQCVYLDGTICVIYVVVNTGFLLTLTEQKQDKTQSVNMLMYPTHKGGGGLIFLSLATTCSIISNQKVHKCKLLNNSLIVVLV